MSWGHTRILSEEEREKIRKRKREENIYNSYIYRAVHENKRSSTWKYKIYKDKY